MPRLATQPDPKAVLKRGASKTWRPKKIEEVRARATKDKWHDADKIDPNKPPTDKQKLFVKLVASGETIMSATVRAGYQNAATYGYTLIKMPNIKALYDEEKAKYEASCQMTRKRVMDGLLEGVEMAKLAGEPASMIAGWREIGKMCGYYEPVTRKVDITFNGATMMDRMSRLSDQELLDMITSADVPALEE